MTSKDLEKLKGSLWKSWNEYLTEEKKELQKLCEKNKDKEEMLMLFGEMVMFELRTKLEELEKRLPMTHDEFCGEILEMSKPKTFEEFGQIILEMKKQQTGDN